VDRHIRGLSLVRITVLLGEPHNNKDAVEVYDQSDIVACHLTAFRRQTVSGVLSYGH